MTKTAILNGNELVIQGGLEAGFSLYTGYPGSPLADFFNILHERRSEFKEKGIRVVIANSEANAAAMASGSKQAGRDVLIAMKSMGLHVAADALSVGNFADPGPKHQDPETGELLSPGVVVVVGDDPWSISTSTAADSRYLYKHLHIPFLEPSTPTELKDWMKVALKLSQKTSVYQGLLLTTFMAEGGGRVEIGEERPIDKALVELDPASFDLRKNVMVPPNSLFADIAMISERFPKVLTAYKNLGLDRQFGNQKARIGIISAGSPFETLKQVLEETGLIEHVHLYKLASSYPLIEDNLSPYLAGLEHLIVVEEKRGFLEQEIAPIAARVRPGLNVLGKRFKTSEGFPAFGGLSYEIIEKKLRQAWDELGQSSCSSENIQTVPVMGELPRRLPTFCPGCPHRETLSLLKDLRKDLGAKGVKLISHGDVGCYSLSFLAPFKEMHNLSAMGQGGALGAGVDLFTTNPSVVLMGDSTFYHSGITDISNSVQMGHTITYILLDNDNTAMTGHQVSPSTGISVEGLVRPHQDILAAVRALGVETCLEVNPSDRYFYKNTLNDYIARPGVKVIVSNKECALTFHGRKKREERKLLASGVDIAVQNFYQINTDACEDCRACVESTGCPGLTQTQDAYGPKVAIDPQICVADSYCTKIKACPSFELVEVMDYHPTRHRGVDMPALDELSHLPAPVLLKNLEAVAKGQDLRVVVTGVGGSGVTTISRVLAEAARSMGGRTDLDFKFVDQKGLAQRNGNVTAHLALYHHSKSHSPVTPEGTADLLLSPDLLDGANHLRFLSSTGIAILDSAFQIPLSIMLDDEKEKDIETSEGLTKKLREKLGERVLILPFKKLSENVFGRAVYASAMVLGAAVQSGRLAFSTADLEAAFSSTMKATELKNNLLAFALGRMLVADGEKACFEFVGKIEKKQSTLETIEQSIIESFLPWQGKRIFINAFRRNLERVVQYFPTIPIDHLALYLHDLYVYNRGQNVEDFVREAFELKTYFSDEADLARAIRTLAKTYWVKDEIFVAHKMLSPLQAKRNQAWLKLGKSFKVTHINRPSFDIFGRKIEFDLNPSDWMLAIMRHMRWLRPLLPTWHKTERAIATRIRTELLNKVAKMENSRERRLALVALENIKGYRAVREEKARAVFGHL